jgi:alpha-galactosidase
MNLGNAHSEVKTSRSRSFGLPAAVTAALLASAALAPQAWAGIRTGIAPTPPMGFNSWYMTGSCTYLNGSWIYVTNIDESIVRGMADYLATSGLREAGYKYVVLDEGWTYPFGDANGRDAQGNIVANPTNFPSGIKALADYVHSRGLEFGLYTEDTTQEANGFIGSAGHFAQDAATFARWGVDYVKFDVYSPDYRQSVADFADALDATGRPMFLYTGTTVGHPDPWLLNYLNAYRFTGDLVGTSLEAGYSNLVYYHFFEGAKIPQAVRKDHWVDIDVMVYADGKGGASPDMLKTSMGMCAMLSTPMFLPAFLWPSVYPQAFAVLTNTEVIAVDQDPGAIQAWCVETNGPCYTWVKPLGGANSRVKAVAVMNTSRSAANTVPIDWGAIGLAPGTVAAVRDLWERADLGLATNRFRVTVPPWSLEMVKLSPAHLSIHAFGKTVAVSWPSAPALRLETTPSLSSPQWAPVLAGPVRNNGVNTDVLPNTGTNSFFRLSY